MRPLLQSELDPVLAVSGEIRFEPISNGSYQAHFEVEISPPPGDTTAYSVIYRKRKGFYEEIDLRDFQREEHLYGQAKSGTLPEVLDGVSELLSSFAVHSEALGCEVFSGFTVTKAP